MCAALPKIRGLGLERNGPFWAAYARDVWVAELEVFRVGATGSDIEWSSVSEDQNRGQHPSAGR